MSANARRGARAGIRDVAALAGVSIKTVSRVVNGEAHVAEETAQKVWTAARALRYQPDIRAAALRRQDGRSRMVGMLLSGRSNPFWYEVRWAVERYAVDHDSFVLGSMLDGNQHRERELLKAMVARRIDALLIAIPSLQDAAIIDDLGLDMPIVVLDGLPFAVEADSVMSDVRAGVARGTRHLIEHGHRRIAYLGADSSLHTIQERRRGFLDEIERAGIPTGDVAIIEDLDEHSAHAAGLRIFGGDAPPTAILAGQVLVARGVIKALTELGLRRSVALVSFDDADMFDLLDPGITVVAQNPQLLGTTAAERAFSRIEGDPSPPHHQLLPVTLVERGSGEIAPPDIRTL